MMNAAIFVIENFRFLGGVSEVGTYLPTSAVSDQIQRK